MNENDGLDSTRQVAAIEHVIKESVRIVNELEALIGRHSFIETNRHGERMSCYYGVAVPELQNILNPGSAPMYPTSHGNAATCSTCCPEGNGAKRGKPWPSEGNES